MDLIDRQAAIDALHMHLIYRMGTDSNKKRLDDWINGVPSAQPEQIARDIATIIENEKDMRVMLKNAEHTETHSCDYRRTETHEPQRMRGKWETIEGWDGDEVYRCSECGEEYVLIDGTPKENGYHFCPNCGARMSEGEEDE